jgi:two-component system, sensor histidine kinase LadS
VSRALAPSRPRYVRCPARLKAWALLLVACLSLPSAALAATTDSALEVRALASAGPPPSYRWIRLQSRRSIAAAQIPVLIVDSGRGLPVELYPQGAAGTPAPLPQAALLPGFGGAQEAAFLVPGAGLQAGQVFYARIRVRTVSAPQAYFAAGTLADVLARGARRELMISLACGALAALALATAAMWLVLADDLFILYAAMTALQALYLAFFSGQGFRWPGLAAASGLAPYAWNVPVALSGAMASLFAREIAELRHGSPRMYRAFGWLAAAFCVLAVANLGRLVGLGPLVAGVGNLMFLGAGVFVLVVAFLAWRRGNRAAGWFLLAWVLLETFAIVTSGRLLITQAASDDALFYYGLPGSMVASAVLTSLGVADRLRQQRYALSEAERRAKTDPLTGVLNRRSLLEQLEALCRNARASGHPVAVLFLDLDFFKSINDSYGHAAGDACLAAVIRPIQTELRQSDIIGRYGGEEFIVVLSGADVSAAEPIAERIRLRVSEVGIEGHGAPIRLTCSIGVASSDQLGVWGEALIAKADVAVYAAKRLGRNRVQVAIPLAA